MLRMEIYIKPIKKFLAVQKQIINLSDIAQIISPSEIADQLKSEKILEIRQKEQKNYLVTIMDIVSAIKKKYPSYTIINLGQTDTIIEYLPSAPKDNKLLKFVKASLVCIILFMGASTAIMSFHSDAQIPDVFKNYYKIFFGNEVENPKIIAIPYSIGLASGIIIFFNHVFGKKLMKDPTPIEVEMSLYETDIYNTLVDSINSQKNGDGK